MKYPLLAEKIINLKNADLDLRNKLIHSGKLSDGYNDEMKALHYYNAQVLSEIIDIIEYPTIDKVGEEANEATWLIIQHAIEQPKFMKKCLKLMKIAVKEKNSDPKNVAYLTDRIAVFEGKPQFYGTHFDWDENGILSPNVFDDLIKVNKRRKSIGMNTLEEQTKIIRKRVKLENQKPPSDFEKRNKEVEAWRRKIGWIK